MKSYKAWFRIYWDPMMQISSKQQIFYYSDICPKCCKLASQVHRCPFSTLDQVRAIVFFSAVTPSAKSLGLISVIATIGMLDLSSTLDLTASRPYSTATVFPQLNEYKLPALCWHYSGYPGPIPKPK
jgi:hypothetical protein